MRRITIKELLKVQVFLASGGRVLSSTRFNDLLLLSTSPVCSPSLVYTLNLPVMLSLTSSIEISDLL